MSVVLGIDGGGTRTRASIMQDDRVLSHVEGGSIKRLRVGQEAADQNLRAMLKEAFSKAGVSRVDAACAGMASSTLPGVKEWLNATMREFGAATSEVVGDEVIALDAAFKGGAGILQIAGTGSNTIGRMPDGSREGAGGWSSRLGDEGSGYWIGLHAVRRALHAYDREEPCGILQKVGEIWGTKGMDELIDLGNDTPGPDFAALAPAINELAEAGDKVAIGVMQQAAQDLVDFVLLVRGKLRSKHGLVDEVPVVWIGSIIGKARIVREAFFAGLKAAAPNMPVAQESVVSLEGALWRAKRLLEPEG